MPDGPVPTGELFEGDGVTTPRYYVEGTRERETREVWARRHVESVEEFKSREAK